MVEAEDEEQIVQGEDEQGADKGDEVFEQIFDSRLEYYRIYIDKQHVKKRKQKRKTQPKDKRTEMQKLIDGMRKDIESRELHSPEEEKRLKEYFSKNPDPRKSAWKIV